MRVLTDPGNAATRVLSCTISCPAVIIRIRLLNICYTCTGVLHTLAALMLTIVWEMVPGGGIIHADRVAGVRLVWVVPGVMCWL